MTDPPSPDRTLEQWRLFHEQVDSRIALQFDTTDGLDRKATAVLAATGVVLGLVINNADHFATSRDLAPLLFIEALVVLAFALAAGVIALWPRPFNVVPEPGPLLDQHANKAPVESIGELLATKRKAFDDNKGVSRSKLRRLRAQMVLLAVGGGLLVGAYVLERLI
jgi:hypothetical protein